jgi:PIN domain nuclease of toxin-antitoxin system
VRIAELSPAIAIDAGQIPRAALADPLDRLLVATARRLDATFLTSDARILEYATSTGNVRVQDAGL